MKKDLTMEITTIPNKEEDRCLEWQKTVTQKERRQIPERKKIHYLIENSRGSGQDYLRTLIFIVIDSHYYQY